MGIPRILAWVILVGMFAFALATYPALPDSIPSGLDPNGRPRGMREKSLLVWLLLPLLSLAITGLMTAIRQALPRRPEWFNFPDKDRFLKLPTRYRAPVITEMQRTLDIAAAASLLPLAFVQYLMWQTALGHTMPLGIVGVIVGSIFVTPVILIVAGRVTSATEAAEKRWKADESPAE
jgi:uncharacterized membrane protein